LPAKLGCQALDDGVNDAIAEGFLAEVADVL
jgi:hypothetical protein